MKKTAYFKIIYSAIIIILFSIGIASFQVAPLDFDLSKEAENHSFEKMISYTDNSKALDESSGNQKIPQQEALNDAEPEIKQESSTENQQVEPTKQQPRDVASEPKREENNVVEIVSQAKQQNTYFKTSIVDGETITTNTYYFTIEHKQSDLVVAHQKIIVNAVEQDNFDGQVQLKEGQNTITISVVYRDATQKMMTVSRNYTVNVNTSDIIITTNLKNESIATDDQMQFIASASLSGKPLEIEVLLNEQILQPLGGTVYNAQLIEGNNLILLRSKDGDRQIEQLYTVKYEKYKTNLILETNLKNQKVEESTFNFYAEVLYNGNPIESTVQLNNQRIEQQVKDFKVELIEGTNILSIQAEENGEKLIQQYKVLYKNPNRVEQIEAVDPKAPNIKTDLEDGTKVKGTIKTFNVWATNANGERIRGKDVSVTLNGTGVPFVWDDSTKTSYKLALNHGENKVVIKTWDADGRTKKQSFVIHASGVQEGDVIGTATISIEASTVGLGYLVKPTKVDIRQGEPTSFILDQLLRKNGFTYTNSGTLANGFYIASINKPNLMATFKIPSDLQALVEEASSRFAMDDYLPDSLGEFDFANGSGWMYSVNGDYPNYGFSDSYLLDGDVVRIRYTLHYGKDIGGFGSMGGGPENNWAKEW